MTTELALNIFQDAMSVIIILVVAIVLPGLLVGLVVAIFQAATSINEQTLSFLPRLVVTLFALSVLSHWIFGKLIEFTKNLLHQIPYYIG